jgi:outer membrane lipoprotein SlyB
MFHLKKHILLTYILLFSFVNLAVISPVTALSQDSYTLSSSSSSNQLSQSAEPADSQNSLDVDSKIKSFINKIKGDQNKTYQLPQTVKKGVEKLKKILPDSAGAKIDEKEQQFTNDDEIRKFAAKKTATFIISKTTGAICAGIGAMIGLASANPLGVGMGAYIGWKAGSAAGSVFGDAVAGSIIDEGWSNARPDFKQALKNQPWAKISSDSLWSVTGTLAGEATGVVIGAKLGAAMGTFAFPVFGTVAGAVIGQWVGRKLLTPVFRWSARKIGDMVYNRTAGSNQAQPEDSSKDSSLDNSLTPDNISQKNISQAAASLKEERDSLLQRYELLLSQGQAQKAIELFNNQIAPLEKQILSLSEDAR